MKVLDPGHRYELESLDGDARQILAFVKREGGHYPGNFGAHAGTNMQEVIRALLHRARYINNQIPCMETEAVIQCLQQAFLFLEIRAKRVKGAILECTNIADLESAETCATCGHVHCAVHRVTLESTAKREGK